MVDLSVIIVNWNTRALLERCLRSVYASVAGSTDLEVIVVDNGSQDGSPDMVTSCFPETTLLLNPGNRGFAAANNQAIEISSGRYLLLLNPDAELAAPAIKEMLGYAEQQSLVAVVGPQLLNSDGTVQSSRRRFPTAATGFIESTVLQRWFPRHSVLRDYYLLDRSDDEIQEVDWLVGACLLVRADAARRIGPLDEGYFMYSEELDWCRRFAANGWKTVYLPAAKVIHHGGQSSDQNPHGRHIRFQYSKARYFERYHGHALAQGLRLFLLANSIFMLAEDLAKLALLGRKREMRRERIRTLASVAAWQLKWVVSFGRLEP